MLRERPAPWAPPLDGWHFEVYEHPDKRVVTAEEKAEGRACSQPRCAEPAVAVLLRTVYRGERRTARRWFCCASRDHLYGSWIENGRVLSWRLVKDEPA